jgi:hypothetical protein
LDASTAVSRCGFHLLHQKFIDTVVKVILPDKLMLEETKSKIDGHMDYGTYKHFCLYNPYNTEQLKSPWQVKEVTAVFEKLKREYDKCM